MRPVHYITLVVAIALIAILYWGGNTTPPAKPKAEMPPMAAAGNMPPGSNTMKPASFDSILAASRAQLPKQGADEVKTIENELAAIRDSSRMAAVYIRLAQVWQRYNQLLAAGYFGEKAAKLENSEKSLNFAGQFFLERIAEGGSESVLAWEAEQAKDCFQRALDISPGNDTATVGMAAVYVNTGEPMRGVGMLKEITQKDPDNVMANQMLGDMSVRSGQYDKAVGRYETVLKKQPDNVDVMLNLAKLYEGQGEKQKAIDLLKRSEVLIDDPQTKSSIEKHINSLK
ncbi:MAG TPA: tetratricopeptide repeat protein [Flavipsychrobacter sp.]|nr:tetratricopeptide repeat protein [Flavipsychrobacter sp.]